MHFLGPAENDSIHNHEVAIRLGFFLGLLLILIALEKIKPRRQGKQPQTWRRFSNLSIVFLNALILRITFPLLAIDAALLAENKSWGLFHFYEMPYWLVVVLTIVLLDLTIYFQHMMFHAVPLFWRFHRMHHADLDFDVTTGVRFHPIEILLSMAIKVSVVVLIGGSALGVLIFEVILNATSLFSHANWHLPLILDKILRWILVTPDMHRVHHSIIPKETNSNFGFNFSFWDKIFGTYLAQPSAGHRMMTIGIDQFRERKFVKLFWMILIPFLTPSISYPINEKSKEEELNDLGKS